MAVFVGGATFLHVGKCGGSWVVRTLEAAGLNPRVDPPTQDGSHWINGTDGRFVFTFVRHPLAWYPSFWRFRQREAAQSPGGVEVLRAYAGPEGSPVDRCLVDAAGGPRPFPAFVDACLDTCPGFLSGLFDLYAGYAHFVGRQESLCDDLLDALWLGGVVVDPNVIRSTPRENGSDAGVRAEYAPCQAARLLAAEASAVRAYYPRPGRLRPVVRVVPPAAAA